MDPRSTSISLCVALLCLLGGIRCTIPDACQCPCPQPPLLDLTEPPQATNCCLRNSTFRYTCIDGYVRKAGSSNLIRCKQTAPGPEWSTATLSCIPDPKRPKTTQQPKITTTTFPTTNSEITPNASIQQVDHARDIREKGNQTTNSTSSPATIEVDRDNPESHQGSHAIRHGLSALGALIFISAILSGIGVICYKCRRSRSNNQQQQQQHQPEEMRPINREENVPCGPAP